MMLLRLMLVLVLLLLLVLFDGVGVLIDVAYDVVFMFLLVQFLFAVVDVCVVAAANVAI